MTMCLKACLCCFTVLFLRFSTSGAVGEDACASGEVRLAGGLFPEEGRVEVCWDGEWGTVCDNGWDANAARVVCRQLGFNTTGVASYNKAHFGEGSGAIFMDYVRCSGDEARLAECEFGFAQSCAHSSDASVGCYGECGHREVRLVGGDSPREGRVEVCWKGRWTAVCDDGWDNTSASVVCKQLGFNSSNAFGGVNSVYGEGSGDILLGSISCSGSEARLLDCGHESYPSACSQQNTSSAFCNVTVKAAEEECAGGEVRLVDGDHPWEGKVEVCVGGMWGSVCGGDEWTYREAQVVCNQLGLTTVQVFPFSYRHYEGAGDALVLSGGFSCGGEEERLLDCPSAPASSTCSNRNSANVICASCANGDVRLVGGESYWGRVEVCLYGQWTRVCTNEQWGDTEALVTCRQLGLPTGGAYAATNFGRGSGVIVMTSVRCDGSEGRLTQCSFNQPTSYRCQGYYEPDNDAGVVCAGECRDGEVRLGGSNVPSEGRVQMCLGGDWWWEVCGGSDQYAYIAQVVCRQLRYQDTGAVSYEVEAALSSYGASVTCSGSEGGLRNCSILTHTGGCSKGLWVSCQSECEEGAVRFGSEGTTYGDVLTEICAVGRWTTVCIPLNQYEANDYRDTVCQQLGFSGSRHHSKDWNYVALARSPFLIAIGRNPSCSHSVDELLRCDWELSAPAAQYIGCTSNYDNLLVSCTDNQCDYDEIRLADGDYNREGRVELCVDGEWGTICSDGWDNIDAQVVCRQLNYSTSGAQAFTGAHFGSGTGPILRTGVQCNPYDMSLAGCHHNYDTEDCSHKEDAGVSCPACPSGSIRLVKGNQLAVYSYDSVPISEGRVEVCVDGDWGSVCDTHWTTADAQATCTTLGYTSPGAIALPNSYYGRGFLAPVMGNVECQGSESTLFDCPRASSVSCSVSLTVGVNCSICVSGDLRLVDGTSPNEGAVEMCAGGRWVGVCVGGDGWSTQNANVVCRQLGYGAVGVPYVLPLTEYGMQVVGEMACDGSEEKLIHCPYNVDAYCSLLPKATVHCLVEKPCVDGAVRLRDSYSIRDGKVELCQNGIWGTICVQDEYSGTWDQDNANVVCRQLGYNIHASGYFSSAHVVYNSDSYKDKGPIWLTGVECQGSESRLVDCASVQYTGLASGSCHHNNDVGVTCGDPTYCVDSSIRLAGGSVPHEGRVEVCLQDTWGTVCDNSWDEKDAEVVCKQLYYAVEGAQVSSFGPGYGPIMADDVECTGAEQSLVKCRNDTDTSDCSHQNDAGVVCQSGCEEGSVMLVGGDSEGRLEVCLNGRWGTVCDYGWDYDDAKVVCRQLGFSDPSGGYMYYDRVPGTGPVVMSNVDCSGNEASLVNCRYEVPKSNEYDCDHYNDVGVSCGGGGGVANGNGSSTSSSSIALGPLIGGVVAAVAALFLLSLGIVILFCCFLVPFCPIAMALRSKRDRSYGILSDQGSHSSIESDSIPAATVSVELPMRPPTEDTKAAAMADLTTAYPPAPAPAPAPVVPPYTGQEEGGPGAAPPQDPPPAYQAEQQDSSSL